MFYSERRAEHQAASCKRVEFKSKITGRAWGGGAKELQVITSQCDCGRREGRRHTAEDKSQQAGENGQRDTYLQVY